MITLTGEEVYIICLHISLLLIMSHLLRTPRIVHIEPQMLDRFIVKEHTVDIKTLTSTAYISGYDLVSEHKDEIIKRLRAKMRDDICENIDEYIEHSSRYMESYNSLDLYSTLMVCKRR